jgi:uncharacterized protein (TIGR03437 family)
MSRLTNLAFATLIVTLPALADVSGTPTLTANTALNLDTGATGASGGDLLWSGSTLTPQSNAKAAAMPGGGGSSVYNALTQQTLTAFSALLSSAPIGGSTLAAGAILVVRTNGGNYAKVLVVSNSGGSLGLQFTTYGASGGSGGPSITAVENAATNIPPGLPNAAVAQGAMFVVKGSNLGPANYTQAQSFPLTNTIGGTSITVTVNGTTVDAIMFYSLAAQVAGILPSKTPTGTGTLKLTYNGQSASAPITVVQNNIGIYTVSSSGTGDAIAFLNSDGGLITPTHAANAGDTVVFWGTGLGPVTFDETKAAVQADMPNVPLQVFIGGKSANVVFRGRNGCCSSADSIYVTVPQGVNGCAVSVLMQIGNLVSNATSIAVASSGRTCTPVNGSSVSGGSTGTHSSGTLSLERVVQSDPSGSTKMDLAAGIFSKVTYSTAATGSQIDIASYGSCLVIFETVGQAAGTGSVTYLDAGNPIVMNAPFGIRNLPRTSIAGTIAYNLMLDQTATTLTAGAYTFTGTGGPDVGPFTANYTMPPVFVWTNQSSITTVNRAGGVTVNWTGGDPAGYVTISGSSTNSSVNPAVSASFTCTARDSDLTFTVPPVVLLSLPASNNGDLSLITYSAQPFGPPAGLDLATVGSIFFFGSTVGYQ